MIEAREGYRHLGKVVAGTSPKIMERGVDATGEIILKAAITSIQLKIWDISATTAVVVESGLALTVASVWVDTFQTDKGWDPSGLAPATLGYNFFYTVPQSYLVGGGVGVEKEYQIEIRVTLTTGEIMWITRAHITVGDALGVT